MKSTVPGGVRSRIASDAFLIISLTVAVFYLTSNSSNHSPEKKSPFSVSEEFVHRPVHVTDDLSQIKTPIFVEGIKPDKAVIHSAGPFAPLIPPVPSLNIPLSYDQVEAGAGLRIMTDKNSVIDIPANAFVDDAGNIVTGKVDVNYREFRDRWDMFVSNVPMHYDSSGAELLESAGMIEFRASQNGKEVFPNPEKNINVMLASVNKADGFNVYFLEEKTNQWKYIEPSQTVLKSVSPHEDDDSAPVLSNFKNVRRDYSFSKSNYSSCLYSQSDMKPRRSFLFGRKKSPFHFEFTIAQRQGSAPENKLLKNVRWTYSGEDASDVYQMIFMNGKTDFVASRRTVVSDMELKKLDDKYTLSFIRQGTFYKFDVYPYGESEFDEKKFDVAYASYSRQYSARIDSERIAYAAFNADTASLNNPEEQRAMAQNSARLMRVFTVRDFGYWNCDKPFKPDLPKTVLAHFIDASGRPLIITAGFMVFNTINSLYSVNNFDQFRFNPFAANIFWAVLPNNRVAIIYPDEFSKHAKDGMESVFIAKIYDDISSAKTAMKKFAIS